MHRITLGNTVFEGQNNAYLLNADGTGPRTLVDTGVATGNVRADLKAGLDEVELTFADIEEVFLTHFHQDHTGLAGEIQAESGATIHAHAADAPLIAGDERALDELTARQRAYFDEWGMPDDAREELLAFMDRFEDASGDPADVTPFEGGERFDLESVELETVHLPGHAAGLTGFITPETSAVGLDESNESNDGNDGDDANRSDGEGEALFSGDALLPHYTPNVGGADVRVEHPLAKYVATLSRIVAREFAVAWPGHRDPIAAPSARAREIAVHHRERTERVVEILREHEPIDTWTVSAHLFGGLSNIHVLHGPGEAYAHLDHLAEAGVVSRENQRYELAEENPDLDSLFPEIVRARA